MIRRSYCVVVDSLDGIPDDFSFRRLEDAEEKYDSLTGVGYKALHEIVDEPRAGWMWERTEVTIKSWMAPEWAELFEGEVVK